MQVVSRVLFHSLLLRNISTIDLCDLPIAAPGLHRNKTGRLKLPQPIWPFNTRGLPYITITNYVRELLPHVFTITASRLRPRGYLVFCGTFCYKNIPVSVPTFSGGGLPCVARTFLREASSRR